MPGAVKQKLCWHGTTLKEDKVISGHIIAADDQQPVPYAKVIIKGTDTYTATDINGNFRLTVPPSINPVIVVSYIGFEVLLLNIDQRSSYLIELKTKHTTMGEVEILPVKKTMPKTKKSDKRQ